MNKKLKGIVISGATGVGKTDLSIKLAKRLNADIISADASQVYKFLDIGTAKVTEDEMQGIKHYMIDVVEPDEDYSVGDFEVEVNEILNEKEENAENVILVGGTGLYIRAITDGFSDLPTKDEKIRKDLEKKSLEELQEILQELDLQAYNEIDLNNKLRLVRAIEVCKITGGKFSELRVKNIKKNNYNFLKVFLTRNREELYERINKRVDIMIQKGLVEEAKKVYNSYGNSLYKISAIGYKELFYYFDGKVSLEEAIEDIKRESRRYAKRQITWFRKEKDYLIYNLSEISEKEIIEDILRNYDNFS
nr:tRNA (adenosine(37)-N6)-dimethylallyltransferase MiaA [uncultured Leptotrichia sp.]